MYFSTDRDRDRTAFARLALSTQGIRGRLEWLWTRDDAELESFAIDEQGSMATLNWNVGGKNELALYDLRSSKKKSVPKLPGEIVGGLTFSRDGRLLAIALSGSARPADRAPSFCSPRWAGAFRMAVPSNHRQGSLSDGALVSWRPRARGTPSL